MTHPPGDVYLDALAAFQKKYRKKKKLLADVDELLSKLQIWDLCVSFNVIKEITKKAT